MQTEVTLKYLEKTTVVIGKELRSFRDLSSAAYTCKELPGETKRRVRRQQNKQRQAAETAVTTPAPVPTHTTPPPEPENMDPTTAPLPDLPAKTKILNLCTYKFHALGDYVQTIRMFGTTDSYSTQIVSITSSLLSACLNNDFRESLHID